MQITIRCPCVAPAVADNPGTFKLVTIFIFHNVAGSIMKHIVIIPADDRHPMINAIFTMVISINIISASHVSNFKDAQILNHGFIIIGIIF